MSTTDDGPDAALLAIVAHGLLGDSAVIGTAALTLDEYWDSLEGPTRQHLLRMIVTHATHITSVLDGLARGLPLQALLAVTDERTPS